jgi:site-specific DNA-methyltransferase (adenine-specific)
VWGGNYFSYIWQFGGKGFIFWKKNNPVDNFSDGELAWSSFNTVAKCFDYSYYGGIAGNTKADSKIHPTQKPVKLYDWILQNYANDGDKILDTHLGSGSIAIACHYAKLQLTACEIDEDYFKQSIERIKNETSQTAFQFV